MILKRPIGAGGLQLQARGVVAALRAMGVPCTLVVQGRSAKGAARVARWPVPVEILRGRSNAAFHLRLMWRLWRGAGEYDVVHVQGYGPEALTAAVGGALGGGRPVVVKPSTAGPGTQLDQWAAGRRWQPWLAWLLRRGVWRWIAISERTRADLQAAGVPRERVALVPNGVDAERYQPLPEQERQARRAEFGIAPEEVVAGAIARLTPHKRIDMLIRAVGALAGELPCLRLWILGRGEEEGQLRALAGECAPQGMIRFVGKVRRPEVPRYLQACDLYVACSQWEGLSNALLEGMACGLAPISTRVSGAEDAIRHAENGLLVAPDDERALADALRRLATDGLERRRLGEAARQAIVKRYSLAATARALVRLYGEACRARA